MLKKYLLNLYNNINSFSVNVDNLSIDFYNDKLNNMTGGANDFDDILEKFKITLETYKTKPKCNNDEIKKQFDRYIFFMKLYEDQTKKLVQEHREIGQKVDELIRDSEKLTGQNTKKIIDDINLLFSELLQ